MSASTKDLLAISQNIIQESSPVPEVVVHSKVLDDGLKAVVVPDSFMNEIMGFAGSLNESCGPKHKRSKTQKPVTKTSSDDKLDESLLKERLEDLVGKLKVLIGEAKEVIEEMTSTGCLGVGPQKALMLKKKSDAYPPKRKKVKKNGLDKPYK